MMLRDLRDAASLTQAEVADSLGTSQSQVSQWELGSGVLGVNRVAALSTLFDVSPDDVRSAADASRDHWLESRDLRVGDKIRNLRDRYGITREELARACDCTAGAVALWESGSSIPRRDRLIAASELFGVEAQYLLAEAGLNTEEIESRLEATDRTPLAKLLRQGRSDAGLTQSQVASWCGCAQNNISSVENSLHLPSDLVLEKMTMLYGLDPLDVAAAKFSSRATLGHTPKVVLPWPLKPWEVPRVRWFRQLRAHMGFTRSELAQNLAVNTSTILAVENESEPGLPPAMRDPGVLRRLGILAGSDTTQMVAAFEPDHSDIAHLIGVVDGLELVNQCDTVAQLVRTLHFRGATWSDIGSTAGLSRQPPINWSNGSVPKRSHAVALAGLFCPPVPADAMIELHERTVGHGEAYDPEAIGSPSDWVTFSDPWLRRF